MTAASTPPLIRAIVEPSFATGLDGGGWTLVIQQARAAQLLHRLAHLLEAAGLLGDLPEGPLHHNESALILARTHGEAVRWEVTRIHAALRSAGIPVILLKGAAYVIADLSVARGRWFSDIDVMVPHAALGDAEAALARSGWAGAHADDAYDQRYYREWMHEIPPMMHQRRRTTTDLHHTILPPTARAKPDARKLLADVVPVAGHEGLYVLSPRDMVLHSATHLFFEGELRHGLRDLVDLDDLVKHFAGLDASFWQRLVARAFAMDLARPLHYALRHAQRLLGTPVPADVTARLRPAGPSLLMRPVMDALFSRALMPDHPTCSDRLTPVARWMLYVRGHYLRMPMHLLVPHLLRKAFRHAGGERE